MTDEQFVKFLKRVKETCRVRKTCEGCRLLLPKTDPCFTRCQARKLFNRLDSQPGSWEMEEIERIIRL